MIGLEYCESSSLERWMPCLCSDGDAVIRSMLGGIVHRKAEPKKCPACGQVVPS